MNSTIDKNISNAQNGKQLKDASIEEQDIDKVLNDKNLSAIAEKYNTSNFSKPTVPKGNQEIVKKNKNPLY
ncbi:hypothetical protein NGH44_11980 [Staphylococcus caprae]|uniref:hypothetical protein n=1 Tax=Staphylococcus caprae TaxID=29380 RepID=UPI002DBB7BD0|nr:hypothetical protein [Staphylococcus caprae]MEB8095863.1 hypothetical protein [Staphylococcus caprae]